MLVIGMSYQYSNVIRISGLKIDLEKNEFFFSVGPGDDLEDLTTEIVCKVGSLPSLYQGLPLDASFKSVAAWDGVKERFRNKSGHIQEALHL